MKVYLDNSVIGRLVDIERGINRGSKMLEEDMAVLNSLIKLCTSKGIELCTSSDAGIEIEKVRSTMPQLADALLVKLGSLKVLLAGHSLPDRNSNRFSMGGRYFESGEDQLDLLAQRLKSILLDKTRITREEKRQAVEWDAYHLAVCKDYGCEVFLTCDYASIWAYRKTLKSLFRIEVKRPVELFRELHTIKS